VPLHPLSRRYRNNFCIVLYRNQCYTISVYTCSLYERYRPIYYVVPVTLYTALSSTACYIVLYIALITRKAQRYSGNEKTTDQSNLTPAALVRLPWTASLGSIYRTLHQLQTLRYVYRQQGTSSNMCPEVHTVNFTMHQQ